MNFYASLPRRHVTIDGSRTPLTGALHALATSGPVLAAALEIAKLLHTDKDASTRVFVRALPASGLEMLVISSGTVGLQPFTHAPDVTVITDRWHDQQGDCALVRILDGHSASDLPFGVVEHPLGDAPFSGDGWALAADPDALTLLVIDGLGHGPLAQNAAVAGIDALRGAVLVSPSEELRLLHDAMKGTVGAVAAVARVAGHGVVDFCGIGNIEATLVTEDRRAGLASYPGVVGQGSPSFRLYRHVLTGSSHLVMHTDGLRSHWSPASYPGLFSRHPALIASVLFRDGWRQSDDALVVVVELSAAAQDALVSSTPGAEVGRYLHERAVLK